MRKIVVEVVLADYQEFKCARCGWESAPMVHEIRRNHENVLHATCYGSPKGWIEIQPGPVRLCPDCGPAVDAAMAAALRLALITTEDVREAYKGFAW